MDDSVNGAAFENTGGGVERTSSDAAADGVFNSIAREAKGIAEDARQKAAQAAEPLKQDARDFAEEKKRQGADRIGDLARAVHKAADEVGREVPKAGAYVHAGANRLDSASQMLRDQKLEEIVGSANRLAHDRPLAFIAGSVAAGFLLARFLKSSANPGGH